MRRRKTLTFGDKSSIGRGKVSYLPYHALVEKVARVEVERYPKGITVTNIVPIDEDGLFRKKRNVVLVYERDPERYAPYTDLVVTYNDTADMEKPEYYLISASY